MEVTSSVTLTSVGPAELDISKNIEVSHIYNPSYKPDNPGFNPNCNSTPVTPLPSSNKRYLCAIDFSFLFLLYVSQFFPTLSANFPTFFLLWKIFKKTLFILTIQTPYWILHEKHTICTNMSLYHCRSKRYSTRKQEPPRIFFVVWTHLSIPVLFHRMSVSLHESCGVWTWLLLYEEFNPAHSVPEATNHVTATQLIAYLKYFFGLSKIGIFPSESKTNLLHFFSPVCRLAFSLIQHLKWNGVQGFGAQT